MAKLFPEWKRRKIAALQERFTRSAGLRRDEAGEDWFPAERFRLALRRILDADSEDAIGAMP